MFAYELVAGNYNRAAWFEDTEAFRYYPGGYSMAVSSPIINQGGYLCLAFGMYYAVEPEPELDPEPNPEPEPGKEDDTEPEPGDTEEPEPPICDPEPSGPSGSYRSRPSRTNEEPPKKEEPINLSCGAAVVDNSAVADFCSVVVRFIPKVKLVNRGEMAGIITGLLTEESRSLPVPDGNAFADIEASPYLDSINLLSAVGLISGCGDNKYNPDSLLTWAELIAFAARFTEPQDVVLSVIDATGHWAEPSIKTVVTAGWLEDKPLDLFATVTYGDLVKFMSGIFGQEQEK